MPDDEKRYIAVNDDGEAIVAFETAPFSVSDWFPIGVGVFGNLCGVHGVGGPAAIAALMAVPGPGSGNDKITRSSVPPGGVGVSGIGVAAGVAGTGTFGVSGIGSGAGSTGVVGTGFVGVRGTGAGVGATGIIGTGPVAGVFGRGPTGVRGTAIDGDSAGVVDGNIVSGVNGVSDQGFGVLGTSRTNRAGVFGQPGNIPRTANQTFSAADPVPQVCLAPEKLRDRDVASQLPRAGVAGDLLAVSLPPIEKERSRAQLWFCVSSGSNSPNDPGAVWAQVQFGPNMSVP